MYDLLERTPGNWTVQHNNNDDTTYIVANDPRLGADMVAEIYRVSAYEGNAALIAAAPAMYEALKDLIGDLGDLHGGSIAELQCHWCGRDYEDEEAGGLCTSDDCPGYIARQAIAQAEGRHP